MREVWATVHWGWGNCQRIFDVDNNVIEKQVWVLSLNTVETLKILCYYSPNEQSFPWVTAHGLSDCECTQPKTTLQSK